MDIIKARKEDWYPGNPHIRPRTWALPIVVLGLLVFGLTSLTGSLVNRNQHELLSHLAEPVPHQ
jgi:hypothetical protein